MNRYACGLLGALLITLSWDPIPPAAGVDRIKAVAWVMVPVWYDCTDPDTGEPSRCLVGYVETWRETAVVPGSATSLTWTVPDFPSGAVAFYPLEVWTERDTNGGGVCRSDGTTEP